MSPTIQYAELKEELVAARKQHDAACILVGIKNPWSSMESPDSLPRFSSNYERVISGARPTFLKFQCDENENFANDATSLRKPSYYISTMTTKLIQSAVQRIWLSTSTPKQPPASPYANPDIPFRRYQITPSQVSKSSQYAFTLRIVTVELKKLDLSL